MDQVPALRDVRCFVAVAEHGGFSRAAVELGLSQPAVSQAITRLERDLGCRLFDRTSRQVHPTPAGSGLLGPARALLAEAASFTTTARQLAARPHPTITLAYPPLLGPFVARIARRLARHQPDVVLDLRTAGRRAAAHAVTTGTAAAAVLPAPIPLPEAFVSIPLVSVPLGLLAVAAGDVLATRDGVRPAALGGYRVLVPGSRPPGGPWARLVAALPPGRAQPVADDIDDYPAALDLVAAGLGVLPVPTLVAGTVRRPDVRFIGLELPPATRPDQTGLLYRLAWRAGPADLADPALLALIRAAQEVLRTR
jgi:DNA-binding transcriptional LysR family regulator